MKDKAGPDMHVNFLHIVGAAKEKICVNLEIRISSAPRHIVPRYDRARPMRKLHRDPVVGVGVAMLLRVT
jgi:hypothetical protein